jgi:hypothetical protein
MIAPGPFLRAVIGINAAGGLLSALELLPIYRVFQDGGLLSWKVARLRRRRAVQPVLSLGGSIFAWPGMLGVLSARIASALACIVCASLGPVPAPLLAVYVVIGCLLILRTPLAFHGGDQFLHITAVACLVTVVSGGSLASEIGLFFLASQLSLVYATSAAVKMISPGWRSGRYLPEILGTGTLGRPSVYAFLTAGQRRAKWAAKLVTYGELLCCLAPWSPPRIAWLLVATAASFHVAIAAIMGLNTFTLAFAATFPAAIYTSRVLYRG